MTNRNAEYEARKRAKGLVRRSMWIPAESEAEFKQMAEFCSENKDYVPFMVRNTITGKFKKAVD